MSAHYTQKTDAVRSLTFDFSFALNDGETITAQSATVEVYKNYGDNNSLGSITNIVRNTDNNMVSLNYTNNEAGYYVIRVTAVCSQQTIKLDAFIQVVD